MSATLASSRRGGPLAILGLVLAAWIAGRALFWESPFPLSLPAAAVFLAEGPGDRIIHTGGAYLSIVRRGDESAVNANMPAPAMGRSINAAIFRMGEPLDQSHPARMNTSPVIAAGHGFLMAAAFKVDWADNRSRVSALAAAGNQSLVSPVAPQLPRAPESAISESDRWSLDAFAFYRQGSGSTSISQGRVPVYGASQIAANLQYRITPRSRHDPRVYGRAYRAFVPDAENEVAAGLSARPYGPVPLRVAAELRVTNNIFGTEIRPAAYAVTELPVARLPFDLRMEAYGGAGYVGGSADTAFVDGQTTITREIIDFNGPDVVGARDQRVRLSLGGGAWGGAQKGASRLDVGPSLRLDLTIGDVPARLSVDWRERVAGDAAPESGVAATLSTRF